MLIAQKVGRASLVISFNRETEVEGEEKVQQGQRWQVRAMVQQLSQFINYDFIEGTEIMEKYI